MYIKYLGNPPFTDFATKGILLPQIVDTKSCKEDSIAAENTTKTPTGLPLKSSKFPEGKERYVRDMFSAIAPQYDRLNTILSFNQDKSWRRRTVKLARIKAGDICLDVCTGTGDFAVDIAKVVGAHGHVVASDFCEPMVRNGMNKVAAAPGGRIEMMVANAEYLPYLTDSFHAATVGFGIRNVAHIDRAVAELSRVVKPGGKVAILEFNRPQNRLIKPFVDFYLFQVLPRIGGLFSRKEAYTYLPESMKTFVSRQELAQIMLQSGLSDIMIKDLNFGTVCIHIGTKSSAVKAG